MVWLVPPLVSAKVPVVPAPIGRPVALVRVPEDGVPRAPLKVTKAPAEPTLTPRAVATLVPSPEIPVETGRPVALVKVAADGVPKFGVVKIGLVANTIAPVPVSSVMELASDRETAVVVACDPAPRKSAREAVRDGYVMVLPVRVGLVPKTADPLPVSSDRAEVRLALVRPLASRLATFELYEKKP